MPGTAADPVEASRRPAPSDPPGPVGGSPEPVAAIVARPAPPAPPGPMRPGGSTASPASPAFDGRAGPGPAGGAERSGCTTPQLRRFIKSRVYVPLHELRRRFEMNGNEDDVTRIEVDGRQLFVGLAPREAGLLAELLGSGDVGYELLLDPASPLIVGLFPMRPVPRT